MDEAVAVWRPVPAEALGSGIYKISPTADYDSTLEEWEFLPGTTVGCKNMKLDSGEAMVAVSALLELFVTVELLEDISEYALKKGDKGAILLEFFSPEEAYEVEFVNDSGETVAQVVLRPSQFKIV